MHLHQQGDLGVGQVAEHEAGKVNGSHPLVDVRRN
jgi:hypothetical protein